MKVLVIVGAVMVAALISLGVTVAIIVITPRTNYKSLVAEEKAKAETSRQAIVEKEKDLDKLQAELDAARAQREQLTSAATQEGLRLEREMEKTRKAIAAATQAATTPANADQE